ncbi:hypothetical protein AB4486_22605, partial [Vibrio sp. 10N.222.55.C6]
AEMASQIAAKGLNVVLVARREKELEEQATLLTERYGIKATTVSAAYFGAFRSVISGLSDHPFRFKPITDSAIIRSLLA